MLKKNTLALSLLALLLSSSLCAEGEAPSTQKVENLFKPFTGRVTGNKVRLRSQPNLDSFVIREAIPGEMFAIIGEDRDFYAVQPPKEIKGYVFRTFVLDNVVEGQRVNVRLRPEMEAPVLVQLHAGDRVNASICTSNNKWLEIQIPTNVNFYIAKEYVENVGSVEMIAEVETRRNAAFHNLNAALLFAQAELQKPFDEIELENVHQKLTSIINEYMEFPDIVEKAREADTAIEDTFVQKKISFLESKANKVVASKDNSEGLNKLSRMADQVQSTIREAGDGKSDPSALGHSFAAQEGAPADKLMVWQALEESLFHVWAATHDGKSVSDFYEDEALNGTVLSGVIEPYTRPVKNRPGDFILRADSLPVAFLYSTKINLSELVGKQVTIVTTPRPNNNFAFPCYFVLSVE